MIQLFTKTNSFNRLFYLFNLWIMRNYILFLKYLYNMVIIYLKNS